MVATLKIVIGVIIVAVCVTALVVGIVLGTRNRTNCDTAEAPTNLRFSQTGDTVTVEWDDSTSSEDCTVLYNFQYEYEYENNSHTGVENITTTLKTLIIPEPCVVLTVHIYAMGDSGELNEDPLTDEYIVAPSELIPPSNLKFNRVGEMRENVEISWDVPEGLDNCEDLLSYQVTITTDTSTEIDVVNVTDTSYPFSYSDFCLHANVEIATVYKDSSSEITDLQYTDSNDDLNIEISTAADGELNFRWTDHEKAATCSFDYSVIRRVGDDNEETIITPGEGVNELQFPYVYCEVASITLRVTFGDEPIQLTEDATQYPDSEAIGIVENVKITPESEGTGKVLSWNEIKIEECAVSYKIEFITDIEEIEAVIQDEITLDVDENMYCYNLGAKVSAIINQEEGTPGEFTVEDFEISAVTGMSASLAANVLTVRWDEHPKKELCSLEYRVEYGAVEPEETEETEASIAVTIPYCVDVDVLVSTFSRANVGWISSPARDTTIQTPETREALGSVSDINFDRSAREITWLPATETLACADIEYEVFYRGDNEAIGSTDTAVDNLYTLPIDYRYCGALNMRVTPVLGEIEGIPASDADELEDPADITPPSKLSYDIDEDNLVISWEAPDDLSACTDLRYKIAIETDIDPIEPVDVDEPSYTILYNQFCIKADITVSTIYNGVPGVSETFSYKDPEDLLDIEVDTVEEGFLTVTWKDHPKTELDVCSITHSVYLRVDGAEDEDLSPDVVDNSVRIPYETCAEASVVIRVTNGGEEFFDFIADITQFPETVGSVSSLVFNQVTREITWEAPQEAQICNGIKYEVYYRADDETDETAERVIIDVNSYTIPNDFVYCSSLYIRVTSLLGEAEGDPVDYTHTFESQNEIAAPSNLKYNIEGENLVISWDAPESLSTCADLSYEITIESDISGDTGPTPVTQTSYPIKNDIFCLEVNIVVATKYNEVTGNSDSLLYKDTNEVSIEVATIEEGLLRVTWTDHPKAILDTCPFSYTVFRRVGEEDGDNVDQEDGFNAVEIPYQYCDIASIVIVASVGTAEARFSEEITQYPTREVIGLVEEITKSSEENKNILSWKEKDFGVCSVEYKIELVTDIHNDGIEYEPTIETKFIIPDEIYCYTLDAKVSAIINEVEAEAGTLENLNIDIPAVTGVRATLTSENLKVEWDVHPKEQQCSLVYKVDYEGNPEPVSVVEQATEKIFDISVGYCVEVKVTVTTFNNDNPTWVAAPAYDSDTLDPDAGAIGAVENIFITIEPEGKVLSWDPKPFEPCSVRYKIEVLTDLDGVQTVYYPDVTTFTVPDEIFCYNFGAQVSAVVNEVEGQPGQFPRQDYAISQVDVISSSLVSNLLSVTWDPHPKAIPCSLQYRMEYSYGGDEDSTETSDTTATLTVSVPYCVDVEVKVTAFHSTNTEWTFEPAELLLRHEVAEGFPASSTVTLGEFDYVNEEVEVSWTEVAVGDCSVTYNIQVVSQDTIQSNQESPAVIAVTDYCFTLQVNLIPVIDGVTGASIPSDVRGLDLDGVTDLSHQVLPDDILEVTWFPHPKEDLCGLTYRTIYYVDGVIEDGDVYQPGQTATFNYVYCGEGRLEVTPIRDANSGATEYEFVPSTDPSSISQTVSDVELDLEDGRPVVTWPEATVGKCPVTYDIAITSEPIQPAYPNVVSPYTIPETNYCFRVRVGIAINVFDITSDFTYSQVLSIGLEDPTNLALTATDTSTLRATWNEHPKLSQCQVSYNIIYSYGTASTSYTQSDGSIDLPIAYCTTATVSVTAVSPEHESEPVVESHVEGDPTSVGKVTDIALELIPETNTARITWKSPKYVSECTSISYTVTATSADGNDVPDVKQCTITDVCIVTLDEFCMATITVVAESISGDPESQVYDCTPPIEP